MSDDIVDVNGGFSLRDGDSFDFRRKAGALRDILHINLDGVGFVSGDVRT